MMDLRKTNILMRIINKYQKIKVKIIKMMNMKMNMKTIKVVKKNKKIHHKKIK